MTVVSEAEILQPGVELAVSLGTPVSTTKSKAGDPVEAVVTAPVVVNGSEVLPAGVHLRGSVVTSERHVGTQRRDELLLRFNEWRGSCQSWAALSSRVTAVDNARESVDDSGTIYGLEPLKVRPSKKEDLLILAAHAHPALLAAYAAVKVARRYEDHPQITFRKGVDFTVVLTQPLDVRGCNARIVDTGVVADLTPDVRSFVAGVPIRTSAGHPPRPADIINLLFVASDAQLSDAFKAAGWFTAEKTDFKTAVDTFFALAERHGYRHAPVSLELLDDRRPDIVFQKQTNTFAKRHHVRLWRAGKTIGNRPVWMAAATHDTGIKFSPEAHTFTHAVEKNVDLERDKIISDLRFTTLVESLSWVERPDLPHQVMNATGDVLETDARLAVLTLRDAAGK